MILYYRNLLTDSTQSQEKSSLPIATATNSQITDRRNEKLREVEASFVEHCEELKEIILSHLGCTCVCVSGLLKNTGHSLFCVVGVLISSDIVHGAVREIVFLQQLFHSVSLEDCTEGLVLTLETETHETIPFEEVDRRRRVVGLDADNRRLDLGRRSEVVLADLDQVINFTEQLCVEGETAEKRGTRLCAETKCEFLLEHEHSAAEHGSVRKELECEGRRDVIRDVGDTHVKVGDIDLEEITMDDLQFVAVFSVGSTLGKLDNHSRVKLNSDNFLCNFQQLDSHVTSTRADFKDGICRLDSGLFNNGFNNERVLQDVLTETGGVEDETLTGTRALTVIALFTTIGGSKHFAATGTSRGNESEWVVASSCFFTR